MGVDVSGGFVALYVNGWGESENGPRPTPDARVGDLVAAMGISHRLSMACTTQEAWALIASVERIGEFSPECVDAWWVEGFPAGAVGGRFEGRNRVVADGDTFEWTRPCEVVAYDPPHHFVYTVGDRFDGTPATRWSFLISATDVGCVVEQQFEHLRDGLSGLRLAAEQVADAEAVVAKRRSELSEGMIVTLQRIRAVLER